MQAALDNSLLVVGAGGHALSCIDVIREEGRYIIAGLIGLSEELGKVIGGVTVVGTDSDLGWSGGLTARAALVAVGQLRTPELRIRLFDHLSSLGYFLPDIISPLAHVSSTSVIGTGAIIMHGANVNAGAQVGANCIINTRALLEHGVIVGNHCHISTAAVVNGDVVIGEGSFVGSGAVIREGIRIGRHCVIGMGALVRHDVPDGTIYFRTSEHGT